MNAQADAEVRTSCDDLLLHEYRGVSSHRHSAHQHKGSSVPVPQQAWTVQGLDELELNQLTEAIRALHEALNLNPASGTARFALEMRSLARAESHRSRRSVQGATAPHSQRSRSMVQAGARLHLLDEADLRRFLGALPEGPCRSAARGEGGAFRASYPEALRTLFALLKEDSPRRTLR